jgi:hypothetical protein
MILPANVTARHGSPRFNMSPFATTIRRLQTTDSMSMFNRGGRIPKSQRYYATIQPKLPSRFSDKPLLSLDHFLQRQRVLEFYREVVRATNQLPVSSTRTEMKAFAREEFERNRTVEDITQIRYLVSTGKEQFRSMRRYLDELVRR